MKMGGVDEEGPSERPRAGDGLATAGLFGQGVASDCGAPLQHEDILLWLSADDSKES